ncbi:hypothetical protein MMC30_003691 [Trapelia coarctata]|nr:hypothetical protein [Trapelia coarctata]
MSSLLSLPAELRKMIHSYALVVGDVYPFRKPAFEKPTMSELSKNKGIQLVVARPAVNLLLTCHTIHQEAESLLYSENVINLPISALTVRFFETALHSTERCSWVKHIRIGFLTDDLGPEQRTLLLQPIFADFQRDLIQISGMLQDTMVEFGRRVHEAFKEQLGTCAWPRKIDPVLENLKLDTLDLDFVACTCINRCCRMAAYALSSFKAGFARGMPKYIRLYGFDFDFYDFGTCNECGWAELMHSELFVEDLIKQWTERRRRGSHSALEEAENESETNELEMDHGLHHLLALEDANCEEWPFGF